MRWMRSKKEMAEVKENLSIPQEVLVVIQKLTHAGFEAFIVGGCVRDLLRGEKPKDWDVTTSATPEEIVKLFPQSFYENKFLTVTVNTDSKDPSLKEVEITTFRAEGKYTDKRHPDEVRFAETLEEDLARRDFTVNAMALDIKSEAPNPKSETNHKSQNPKHVLDLEHSNLEFVSNFDIRVSNFKLVDPFNGQEDLKNRIMRAVGDSEKRFAEDALRMFRAVRLATELGFSIEDQTKKAIKELVGTIAFVAKERIRDEFVKLVLSAHPKDGIELLREVGLLSHIFPELEEGVGIEQRGPHKYDVWEHNLRAVDYAAKEKYSLRVRLAALFHDVAKPRTRVRRDEIWTFYGHDVVGAKMTYEILLRLRFPERETEVIANLVRRHLFSYKLNRDDQYRKDLVAMGEDPDKKDIEDSEDMQETTDSAIRRLIRNIGAENIGDLVKVRICDRIATGVPKAVPYRLRHFQFRVERVLREGEATNVRMLAVRGGDVLTELDIKPGPRVGHILNVLLEEVLDDPAKNTWEYLIDRMKGLDSLSDDELLRIRQEAEDKFETREEERIADIKSKYYVK